MHSLLSRKYHVSLRDLEVSNTHRDMIYDHVKFDYAAPSEFSSWSVSLLYVLVHAVSNFEAIPLATQKRRRQRLTSILIGTEEIQ